MYCSHCGYKLDDMANFCPVCGTRRAVIDANAMPAQPIVGEPAPAAPVEKASVSNETSTAEQVPAAKVPAEPSISAAAQTDERKVSDESTVTAIPSPSSDTASGKPANRITVTLPKIKRPKFHIPKVGAKKTEKTKKENVRTAPAASRFQVLAKLKEKFMQLSLAKKILAAAGSTIVLLMVFLILCFGPKGAFMFVAYGNMDGPLYPRVSISSFIRQYRIDKKFRDFDTKAYGADPSDHKQESETSASKSTPTDDGKSAIDELLEKYGQKQSTSEKDNKAKSESSSEKESKEKSESSSSSSNGKSAIDELLEKYGQKQSTSEKDDKAKSESSSSSSSGKSAIQRLLEKYGKTNSTEKDSTSTKSSSGNGTPAIDALLEKYGKPDKGSSKSESNKNENSKSDSSSYDDDDRTCPYCSYGRCRSCNGKGYKESYSPGLGREKKDCWNCNNGRCTRCGGDGKL